MTQQDNGSGLTRRQLLKRGAIVGTAAVWVPPVIQSIAVPAAAAGSYLSQDISYLALLLVCGNNRFRIKWETNGGGGLNETYGTSFSISQCTDQLFGQTPTNPADPNYDPVLAAYPPDGYPMSGGRPDVNASFNAATGNLTVNLGLCTLIDFIVKCGTKAFDSQGKGCQDPNEVIRPILLPASGIVVFRPCNIDAPLPLP